MKRINIEIQLVVSDFNHGVLLAHGQHAAANIGWN